MGEACKVGGTAEPGHFEKEEFVIYLELDRNLVQLFMCCQGLRVRTLATITVRDMRVF